jgi:hypothetical protein
MEDDSRECTLDMGSRETGDVLAGEWVLIGGSGLILVFSQL